MKFPYRVKYNGVFYPPNTEIVEPKKETSKEVKAEPKTAKTEKAAKGDK